MSPTLTAKCAYVAERVIDAIKVAHAKSGIAPSDRSIAEVAGVDPSVLCRWRRGQRVMGYEHIHRLAERYGMPVVYGAISDAHAELAGAAPVRLAARGAA